ncbi:MAG: fumarate hydratase [Candidatus Omnitrophota bacterium]
MRRIDTRDITSVVAKLCVRANTVLRKDVRKALARSLALESAPRAKKIIRALLDNARYAQQLELALCQDTGLAQVFVNLGRDAQICGGNFLQAVNRGIAEGYKRGGLRNSVVSHPLKRNTRPKFAPGLVHVDIVEGAHLELILLPKGFGCENKSLVRMFNPTESIEAIREFIVAAVKKAGPAACPPFVIGIGIGGSLDYAALLAKKALLQPIGRRNLDKITAKLEKQLFKEINQLGIGPMGLGGKTTCLGVNVLTHPTHIAGLPVAVNISCHALRSAAARL